MWHGHRCGGAALAGRLYRMVAVTGRKSRCEEVRPTTRRVEVIIGMMRGRQRGAETKREGSRRTLNSSNGMAFNDKVIYIFLHVKPATGFPYIGSVALYCKVLCGALMDPQEAGRELSFIRQVMEDSRSVVMHDGRPFIIWGILVVVGLVASYMLAGSPTMDGTHLWIWVGIAVLGWVWSWFDRRRTKAIARAETFTGKILQSVWLASGVAVTLIGLTAFLGGGVSLYVLPSLTAFVLGSAYFTTGRLMRFSWVQVLAGCWWIGGVLLLFVPDRLILLLYAGMMLAFQVVPGIYIQQTIRRELIGNSR